MSAKDFFDNVSIQQASTDFALKEKGIELAKQVDVNLLNTVGTELGGLVSDLQGALGAITGGIGGLLDSVATNALGALGGLVGGLDDLVGDFMKNLPTSINFPVPQIPGLPDIPQIPGLPNPSNIINVPGITDLSNQLGGAIGQIEGALSGGIEGAIDNVLGNLKIPTITIGGLQFDMPAITNAVQKQSEEIIKVQEEQVEVDIIDRTPPVGKADYEIDDNNEVVVETTAQLNELVAKGDVKEDTVVHVKETASYVVTKPTAPPVSKPAPKGSAQSLDDLKKDAKNKKDRANELERIVAEKEAGLEAEIAKFRERSPNADPAEIRRRLQANLDQNKSRVNSYKKDAAAAQEKVTNYSANSGVGKDSLGVVPPTPKSPPPQTAIPEGVPSSKKNPATASEPEVQEPGDPTPNPHAGEQYVNLHEHNKARKAEGKKPVLPKNGKKTGKIDGVPVVTPKPLPPKKTTSTKASERLAAGSPGDPLAANDIDQEIANIQAQKEAERNRWATQKQTMVDSGASDDVFDAAEERHFAKMDELDAKIDNLKTKKKSVEGSLTDDTGFDNAAAGNDDSFDAALNGGSASTPTSSVETTSEVTTTSTSETKVTETGGEVAVQKTPVKTEAEKLKEAEEIRVGQEKDRLDRTYTSVKRAGGAIKYINGKLYPNRKYEAYESGGSWRIRRTK